MANCQHECAICAKEEAAREQAERAEKLRADLEAAMSLIKPGYATLLNEAMAGKSLNQLARWWGCTRGYISFLLREALKDLAGVDGDVASHVLDYLPVRAATREQVAAAKARKAKGTQRVAAAAPTPTPAPRYSHEGERNYAPRKCANCKKEYTPTGARQEYCPEHARHPNRPSRSKAAIAARRAAEEAQGKPPVRFGGTKVLMA